MSAGREVDHHPITFPCPLTVFKATTLLSWVNHDVSQWDFLTDSKAGKKKKKKKRKRKRFLRS